MDDVEVYIANLQNENQKRLISFFHSRFKDYPNITPKIRFRVPFYYQKTWVCYINPIKPHGIEICFIRGFELSNQQGILDAKKRNMIKGVTFFEIEKKRVRAVEEIFMEALELERTVKFVARNKRTRKREGKVD
jgi:hypothetical protein